MKDLGENTFTAILVAIVVSSMTIIGSVAICAQAFPDNPVGGCVCPDGGPPPIPMPDE